MCILYYFLQVLILLNTPEYGDGGCIYIFTNKFTCNFIEGEGNTCWKEVYYINPADIRKRDVYYEK